MIIEIENFVTNAQELRERALSQEFIDFEAPDGQVYKRVQLIEIPELVAGISRVFEEVEILGTGFRLNFNAELPNQAIHSDLGWGTHALVLYLSAGPGGTAFWRHRQTGSFGIKTGQIDLLELIDGDWDKEDKWEQRYLCEAKFGKAVIYPSWLFHSRYPLQAYGDSPETGRLVAVAFFNVKE